MRACESRCAQTCRLCCLVSRRTSLVYEGRAQGTPQGHWLSSPKFLELWWALREPLALVDWACHQESPQPLPHRARRWVVVPGLPPAGGVLRQSTFGVAPWPRQEVKSQQARTDLQRGARGWGLLGAQSRTRKTMGLTALEAPLPGHCLGTGLLAPGPGDHRPATPLLPPELMSRCPLRARPPQCVPQRAVCPDPSQLVH